MQQVDEVEMIDTTKKANAFSASPVSIDKRIQPARNVKNTKRSASQIIKSRTGRVFN